MDLTFKALNPLPFQTSKHFLSPTIIRSSPSPLHFSISSHTVQRHRIKTCCILPSDEVAVPSSSSAQDTDFIEEEEEEEVVVKWDIWKQIKEIVTFAGPAAGLWVCGPLMSLIDTAVIGQGSSLELAALGPGTVVCDYVSYVFMFISIATSNMVATSLAREGQEELQHTVSVLLFVGFTCGVGMLLLTKFAGARILAAFTGTKNLHIVPAANTYIQIRGLAWPALLAGWVAQSASLGMKDSWGPLKALAVASAVNAIGDIVLCSFLGYGIAGAAWATMVSQVIAAFIMIESLENKGINGYSMAIPSPKELQNIFELAAPVFVLLVSKVAFYSLLAYFATSMGTITIAAHQVMIQMYCMCNVWGEPLSQTAQSYMPELIFGIDRHLKKARRLLKSLLIIGGITGSVVGITGTIIPWLFPKIFTADIVIIGEMHKVLLGYLAALVVTPSINSLEGTLLAGRDLRFLSFSMTGCFTLGSLLVVLVSRKGFGLSGLWWALAGFQWARFFLAIRRLLSRDGLLYSEEFSQRQLEKLKAI